MNPTFFDDLPAFSAFEDACDPAQYQPAPDDWLVVLTDVEGSTKAIEAGRYKDVNMLGAACITAVVNVCADISIPYVFGGDGATLLIPPQMEDVVCRELLALKHAAQVMHGLPLRVGIVPMADILARGKRLEVAKYRMPTGCVLAMFRGGGANLADDLVKHGGFALEACESDDEPDLTGLSCRWKPIEAQRDTMLTLLVMLAEEDGSSSYQQINQTIVQLLSGDAAPISLQGLRYSWPGWRYLRQSQMMWRRGHWARNLLKQIGMVLLFHVLYRVNGKLGAFDVVSYRDDMMVNSDYRKFDDLLRMVVDCTQGQADAIEAYLKELWQEGSIVYGTHYSKTALMTCFVQSTASDGHVHFIDGSDGGYALAARQLKQQLSERA